MTVTELTLSDAFAAGFVGSFGALAIVIVPHGDWP